MKTNEMEDICKSHLGKCKECELNCIANWLDKQCTWCLLEYRLTSAQNYRKALKEQDFIRAQKIQDDYINMERTYLKQ